MVNEQPDTNELIRRASAGDSAARELLLLRHRDRLKQMIRLRMDPRVAVRVDPSDVVQETMIEASSKLNDFLERRPIPFYAWLRQIAWERLISTCEKHVHAQKRTIQRERRWDPQLPDESVVQLAGRFVHSGTSPSRVAIRRELRERVRTALDQLGSRDREVLVLWYLEELSAREIAAVLDLTEAGVKSRHRRALERLLPLLSSEM